MRIADRIANKVLENIEEKTGKNFTKKEYLDLECVVADTIRKEINCWLGYDTDFQKFEGVKNG